MANDLGEFFKVISKPNPIVKRFFTVSVIVEETVLRENGLHHRGEVPFSVVVWSDESRQGALEVARRMAAAPSVPCIYCGSWVKHGVFQNGPDLTEKFDSTGKQGCDRCCDGPGY